MSSGQLRVVSTGSDLPVLDLRQVSQELNEAAAGADLVIFEVVAVVVTSWLVTLPKTLLKSARMSWKNTAATKKKF